VKIICIQRQLDSGELTFSSAKTEVVKAISDDADYNGGELTNIDSISIEPDNYDINNLANTISNGIQSVNKEFGATLPSEVEADEDTLEISGKTVSINVASSNAFYSLL